MGSEEVVRKPKLFFVSTSATTTTLQTASICYVSTAAYATCSGRKRRAITAFSEMETVSAETRRSRFQSTRSRKWRQGRKIPTLLDHHHLHLYLLHYHIFSVKRSVHSTRGKRLWSIVCSPYLCDLMYLFVRHLFCA